MVGIQAPKKVLTEVLSKEDKRIWCAISWPSSLADALQRSRETAKAKTKLKIEAFQAT